MKYNFKAHKTKYKNTWFRSRLEARWAAFFDLVGWEWEYEPYDFEGWTPDFLVHIPCTHSECHGKHSLLVEVKPYNILSMFYNHPCLDYPYGQNIPADASAAFGVNPTVSEWQMAHGSGGGVETVENWVRDDVMELWAIAGNITQWQP